MTQEIPLLMLLGFLVELVLLQQSKIQYLIRMHYNRYHKWFQKISIKSKGNVYFYLFIFFAVPGIGLKSHTS